MEWDESWGRHELQVTFNFDIYLHFCQMVVVVVAVIIAIVIILYFSFHWESFWKSQEEIVSDANVYDIYFLPTPTH